jgi:hypothetical protein
MNVLDLIAFIIFAVVSLTLLTLLIVVSNGYNKLKKQSIQQSIDKTILFNKLQEVVDEIALSETTKGDGFIKFLSESRDWAFEYIEEVQVALEEYAIVADSMPVNRDISVEKAEQHWKAYEKLVSYLPKEKTNIKAE